jgi:hypothetical protein
MSASAVVSQPPSMLKAVFLLTDVVDSANCFCYKGIVTLAGLILAVRGVSTEGEKPRLFPTERGYYQHGMV